jgi:hypothetical protein
MYYCRAIYGVKSTVTGLEYGKEKKIGKQFSSNNNKKYILLPFSALHF